MFTTADEFLICYAARDWSVSLRSVSRAAQRRENIDLSMRKIFSIGRIHNRDVEKKVKEVKHAFEYPAIVL